MLDTPVDLRPPPPPPEVVDQDQNGPDPPVPGGGGDSPLPDLLSISQNQSWGYFLRRLGKDAGRGKIAGCRPWKGIKGEYVRPLTYIFGRNGQFLTVVHDLSI